jgi:cell division protein FtsQ
MRRQAPSAGPAVFDGNVATGSGSAAGPDQAVVRQQPDPWRIAFFGLLCVGIAAVAVWTLFGSRLLVVRHVQVTGTPLVSATQVRRAAAIRLGVPLADVNTGAIARRIERIDAVATAQVSRSWPDTIVITVRDRTPALAVASGGKYELIDGAGVTVRLVSRKPAGMPLLTAPPAVLRGSPAIGAAVGVLRELPSWLRGQVRSVTASPADGVTLRLADGITVRWGGTGQAALKAAELAELMRTHATYYDVSDPSTAVTAG